MNLGGGGLEVGGVVVVVGVVVVAVTLPICM